MKIFTPRTLALALCFTSAACGPAGSRETESSGPAVVRAIAVIRPTASYTANGVVHFEQTGDGVRIDATIEGLAPGNHGFHVHEWGDASAPNGKSAGGHFNPASVDHALPDSAVRHAGDLGNLEADASGKAVYTRLDHHLSLEGPTSVIGRSVVIHARADDGGQPSGNAGARVAVGVIGIAKDGIQAH